VQSSVMPMRPFCVCTCEKAGQRENESNIVYERVRHWAAGLPQGSSETGAMLQQLVQSLVLIPCAPYLLVLGSVHVHSLGMGQQHMMACQVRLS